MISLDVKPESSSSSPISLSVSEEEPTVSFSELLKGVKVSKTDKEKEVQNGILVLSLDTKDVNIKGDKPLSKKETLISLLKQDDKNQLQSEDVLELHPKITQNLTPKEIKALIADAKEFLKNKIINSDDYKRAEIKDLPKTLKGLSEVAKKFGIDVTKITLEEVKINGKQNTNPIELAKTNGKQNTNPIELAKTNGKQNTSPIELAKTNGKQNKSSIKTQKTEDSKEEILTIQKKELPISKKSDTEIQEAEIDNIVQKLKTKEDIRENIKVDDKKVLDTQKDIKSTPLFKAKEKIELTTEQLVQTKQFRVEEKTPKTKADETLKLLLRGEKPSQIGANLTADFSVATAKVIAPNATTKVNKSMEQLLHGELNESASKMDGITAHKADSFEVKLNEAKQMIKYLSQDVKTAIEDYKSPFTRVKIQLNPQKLGEVDLTIVQRGKNLHVNISSNNTAINTLSMNANELRTQLTNSGINNATLNFNSGSQNSEQQSSQQQQNRQNERRADEEYNYFENEEQNEEILTSLEIVVPSYA